MAGILRGQDPGGAAVAGQVHVQEVLRRRIDRRVITEEELGEANDRAVHGAHIEGRRGQVRRTAVDVVGATAVGHIAPAGAVVIPVRAVIIAGRDGARPHAGRHARRGVHGPTQVAFEVVAEQGRNGRDGCGVDLRRGVTGQVHNCALVAGGAEIELRSIATAGPRQQALVHVVAQGRQRSGQPGAAIETVVEQPRARYVSLATILDAHGNRRGRLRGDEFRGRSRQAYVQAGGGGHVHGNAVHGACGLNNAGAVELVDSLAGEGLLEHRQSNVILGHVETRHEDQVVEYDGIRIGVVRAARVPAGSAIDRVAAGRQVGHGALGNRVRRAVRRFVLADDYFPVVDRQHPHINVRRAVEAEREALVKRQVEILVVMVALDHVLGGQARVFRQNEGSHEGVAVGEQVEVAAAVNQADVVLRRVPVIGQEVVEAVIQRTRAIVDVVNDRLRAVLQNVTRPVIANPYGVRLVNDEVYPAQVSPRGSQRGGRRGLC